MPLPEARTLSPAGRLLPPYLWKMLRRSLKSVILFGPGLDESTDESRPGEQVAGKAVTHGLDFDMFSIHVEPPIAQVVAESFERLPALVRGGHGVAPDAPQAYISVPVAQFLDHMHTRLVAKP